MKMLSRPAAFLFAAVMLLPAVLMNACSSSSSNSEPSYTGKYHLFTAQSGVLGPDADGSFTLELSGSVEAVWIKEKSAGLAYSEEDPQELISSVWGLQYGNGTPNAIILVEDEENGVQGYFISLSNPAYAPGEVTFSADWIGGATGLTPPSGTVEFTEMLLLVCNEEDGPTLETEEVSSMASPAVSDTVEVYTTTGTGIDPQVALAFANINFSEAIGQVMANKTADMQSTISMINSLEDNKNVIRGIENKICSNQMPDNADKANLTAFGFSGWPSCSDISSPDCKNSWLTFLSNCIDTLRGQQQQYTTHSSVQQLQLQQLMQSYNTANQLASNMIAALGKVTDTITGNIGR